MKKLFFLLMLISVMSKCEWQEEENSNIIHGKMDDYYFDNNIAINNIQDALDYVYMNTRYVRDINEYWQLPKETAILKTGDCEDFCIFFMYLLKEKLGINSYLLFIKIGDSKDYHAMVYIEETNYFYETTWGCYFYNLQDNYKIINKIPYAETIYMTYYYHKNIL